jgi:hypothetical protein
MRRVQACADDGVESGRGVENNLLATRQLGELAMNNGF